MHSVTEVLNDVALDLAKLATKAGDILRSLTNVTQPTLVGEDGRPPEYKLDVWVQDRLVHALHERFAAVLPMIKKAWSEGGDIETRRSLAEATVILARLLQFDLGLVDAWTLEMQKLCEPLCANIFQLILVRVLLLRLD